MTQKFQTEKWAVDMFYFFQAEDGIRDLTVTGVQTCALPISISGFTCSNDVAGKPVAGPATTRAAPSAGCHQQTTVSPCGSAARNRSASSHGSPLDSARM